MEVESRAVAGGDDSGFGAGADHMSDSGGDGDSGVGSGAAHMSESILGAEEAGVTRFSGQPVPWCCTKSFRILFLFSLNAIVIIKK